MRDTMSNEDPLERQRREYQWNAGYDRDDEHDRDPDWASSISVEEDETDATAYTHPITKFVDDDAWIESDTVYNLMKMR